MPRNAPYIITLEPGTHHWCSCGKSAKMPLCDGSHKGTGKEPVAFVQEKKGPAPLCGCGRTLKPPFCDGSHARRE